MEEEREGLARGLNRERGEKPASLALWSLWCLTVWFIAMHL